MIIQYLKELIVLLAIGGVVFKLAQPIALRFCTAADFCRRRNLWFVLTTCAFLSPNFWVYVLIAAPLLIWASGKDSNPIALYLILLHVVPPVPVNIPIVGIRTLFQLDNYRILAFCVLLPTVLRRPRSEGSIAPHGFDTMDALLIGWGILQAAIFIPPDLPNYLSYHDSVTNVLRRTVLFLLDIYILYFAVSRYCNTRRGQVDALGALCLACGLMAMIALFEFLRHWLLYVDLAASWSLDAGDTFYLFRGDALRAKASSGHPLALGYLLAIGFGTWLYLQTHIASRNTKLLVSIALWAGLFAAYSRGPWIGAVAIYFAFAALGPRALSRVFQFSAIGVLLAGVVMASPLGARIIAVLPFMGGSVDSGSTLYRQQIFQRSWEILQKSPFFGDPLAYLKMEDLRQGQGIIDIVNTYAEVGLFYGFVGLTLFTGLMVLAIFKTYGVIRRVMETDRDLALLGAALTACMLGTLLMICSCSFILGYPKIYYLLAGLASAYVRLKSMPQEPVVALPMPPKRRWAPR